MRRRLPLHRCVALSAAVGIGGLLTLVGGVPALASTPSAPAATVPASVIGSATTPIGRITVRAANLTVAPGPATGPFVASGDLVPPATPVLGPLASYTFAGPVRCLDVTGHRAGLIYPITSASGPVGSSFKGLAVSITVQDNGPGQPEQIGFYGPAPINNLTTCPALVGFLPVQSGHITVTPAH